MKSFEIYRKENFVGWVWAKSRSRAEKIAKFQYGNIRLVEII